MIKIVTVVGARPQFIKASMMSSQFNHAGIIQEVLLHTGQHFDPNMSDVFFSQLTIPQPKYNLGINNASHGKMTGQMLQAIEEVLMQETPEYVLVYGDTNSTLAGALAARKLLIPVIHVEAGLRSRNRVMPEETNRILTDRISDLLCCPTDVAVNNLVAEGFNNFDCVFQNTGDIMEDTLRACEGRVATTPGITDKMSSYVLCTVHRSENTDNPERLKGIVEAWKEIAEEADIVIPLHPRTKQKLGKIPAHPRIHFLDPVGYLESLQLIRNSAMVMTDSGGLQKEAYLFQKFCITLRDETEWSELTDLSVNFLAGANTEKIVSTYRGVRRMSWNAPKDIYGGGNARFRIHDMIIEDARAKRII